MCFSLEAESSGSYNFVHLVPIVKTPALVLNLVAAYAGFCAAINLIAEL